MRLAQVEGLPAGAVVTPEHRHALIAWARAEGGGVDPHCGRFNPLNTKLLNSDLGPTPVCARPGQTFATVDYPSLGHGVEAAVRTIRGQYQNRARAVLTNPNTSAEDVLRTIAHPEWYPGNACWACPGTTYEGSLLRNLAAVRAGGPSWYGATPLRLTPSPAALPPLPPPPPPPPSPTPPPA